MVRAVTSSPRVLMYSHDGFGLGHLKRNLSIADRIVETQPGANVILLNGTAAIPFFEPRPGIDLIKLPSICKKDTGVWDARTLSIGKVDIGLMRTRLIKEVAETFAPDIFLVDYLPAGVWNELLPTLRMLKSKAGQAKLVLGLRDILDAPEITKALWRESGAYQVISEFYDKILVYGCPKIFDTAAQYDLCRTPGPSVEYCGYLSPNFPGGAPSTALSEVSQQPGEVQILVTAGGGADAFPMMRSSIGAVGELARKRSLGATIITGPLMADAQRRSLKHLARGLPVSILTSVPDMSHHLAAADLIVTMGGYNAMMEALRSGKTTLVIPRAGPSAEQTMRAEIFAQDGLVQALRPGVKATELAAVIARMLEKPPRPSRRPKLDGLKNAVRHLQNMLASSDQPANLNVLGPQPYETLSTQVAI